jgi:YHS domain-containing protein
MRGIALFAFATLLSVSIFAQSQKNLSEIKHDTTVVSDSVKVLPAGSKTPWNAVCPVMNEEIDLSLPLLEYKGKVIGVCCNVCLKKFKKDPEKYLSRLTEDGKAIKENQ